MVKAFSKPSVGFLEVKEQMRNCMLRMRNLNLLATHIYRKGNHCKDKLINLGLLVSNFTWWSNRYTYKPCFGL